MFKQIVVPLDGSAFSERALPVAMALAKASGAGLALVRVVEVVAPGEHEPGVISYLDEHRVAVAQDYVTQAAMGAGVHNVSAEAYLAHDAATGILARALDAGADLIVMTTHGTSWPAAGALGSVAARLIAESAVPILLVGPKAVQQVAGQPAATGAAQP